MSDSIDEEFRFIERVHEFITPYFSEDTKTVNIIGLGEMLFFAHRLSTYMYRILIIIIELRKCLHLLKQMLQLF